MQRFNLLIVQPEDYTNYALLRLAVDVSPQLRRLGYDVRLAGNEFLRDATNMVFGAHHLAAELAADLPPDTIVYNTEQLRADGRLVEALRPFVSRVSRRGSPIWATSRRGVLGLGNGIRYVQPGYVPESSTVDVTIPTDIDVLFFGKVNPRRMVILDAIMRAGISVHVADGVYLADRDALVARQDTAQRARDRRLVLEMARVAYALSNRRALVTELGRGARLDPDLRDGVLAGTNAELAGIVPGPACGRCTARARRAGVPGVFTARPGRDGEECSRACRRWLKRAAARLVAYDVCRGGANARVEARASVPQDAHSRIPRGRRLRQRQRLSSFEGRARRSP
jgi:hypothetical protein